MENELKPCPFCGGDAELRHECAGPGYSYIQCDQCGIKSVSFMKAFDRSSDEEAISYWNRRCTDGT